MKKAIWLGDSHFPFSNSAALRKIVEFVRKFQPEIIGQIGDLYDQYSFSKYTTVRNQFTPQQEMRRGFKMATEMWASLRAAAPRADRFQILGNHDLRIRKRLLERLPDLDLEIRQKKLVDLDLLFAFDGVKVDMNYPNEIPFEGYLAIHGFRNKGEHVKYYHQNVVLGHLHVGGVDTIRAGNKTLWELNCGFLGNPKALVFKYGETGLRRWTPGFGLVDDLGPRFVAL